MWLFTSVSSLFRNCVKSFIQDFWLIGWFINLNHKHCFYDYDSKVSDTQERQKSAGMSLDAVWRPTVTLQRCYTNDSSFHKSCQRKNKNVFLKPEVLFWIRHMCLLPWFQKQLRMHWIKPQAYVLIASSIHITTPTRVNCRRHLSGVASALYACVNNFTIARQRRFWQHKFRYRWLIVGLHKCT